MNGSELTSFSPANSLKNLFYRILHLYSAGVGLVFVIEGRPSPMKVRSTTCGEAGRESFMNKLREVNNYCTHTPQTNYDYVV